MAGAPAEDLRQRILLADQSQPMRDYLGTLLEGLGFAVTLVAEAKDVEHAFKAAAFDLVLIDFMDGQREGVSVAERLAVAEPRVPVVVFADILDWKAVSSRLDGKVAGVLTKPFDLETEDGLFPLLDRFFERAESNETDR